MGLAVEKFITADGTFIFTLTSNSYKLLTLNLLAHLRRIGAPWRLAVVCADKASHRFFRQEGYAPLLMEGAEADYGPQIIPFGTRLFQGLNRKKLDLLAEFSVHPQIRTGIYLDGDLAIYADPLPDIAAHFAAAPETAILFQCDENTRVACTRTSTGACPQVCSGVIAWRHGVPPSLFRVTEAPATWAACPEDQVFINKRLVELGVPYATLPRDAYPNGKFAALFGPGAAQKGKEAKLLHYNFIVGDMKRKRMIANGDWHIPY